MWKHKVTIFLFSCGLICSYLFLQDHFILVSILLSISFALVLFFGVSQVKFNYFVQSINHGNQGISLTFDDGPDSVSTPQILSILKKHDVKGAFFLIGEKVVAHPELTKEIINQGHIIGNHSYSHRKDLAVKSTSFLFNEFSKCEKSIHQLTGVRPNFVRIPFGLANPNYYRALKKSGFISIGWSLRSFDTMYKDSQKLELSLKNKIKHNSIVLLHDSNLVTLDILESFIIHCKENGMTFASLDKNINKNAYK
jgi:peptidoglycan/xylan/chitin deacetylase (PgdA/CDA1 family)